MSVNWRIAILRAVAWLLSIQVLDTDDVPVSERRLVYCSACREWTPIMDDRSCGQCAVAWGPDYHYYPSDPVVMA